MSLEGNRSEKRPFHSKIWMYWHQGFDYAPELIQVCVTSWRRKNPEHEIILLDKDTLDDFVSISPALKRKASRFSLAAWSDIVRINLLATHGGIWIDTTVLCTQPLHLWFDPLGVQDFFAFANPGPDRMLSSWFLAADHDSIIVKRWQEAVHDYWGGWKWRRPYYWFHYIFGDLYAKYPDFKESWDQVPKVSSDVPHYLTPFRERFFEQATSTRIENLNELNPPLLKLTHKCLTEGYPTGSMIDYVLHSYAE